MALFLVRETAVVVASFASRRLSQTASFACAIFSMVRPLKTEVFSCFAVSVFAGWPALLISHTGLSSADLILKRCHSPVSFLPDSQSFMSPFQ